MPRECGKMLGCRKCPAGAAFLMVTTPERQIIIGRRLLATGGASCAATQRLWHLRAKVSQRLDALLVRQSTGAEVLFAFKKAAFDMATACGKTCKICKCATTGWTIGDCCVRVSVPYSPAGKLLWPLGLHCPNQ